MFTYKFEVFSQQSPVSPLNNAQQTKYILVKPDSPNSEALFMLSYIDMF